MNISSQKDKSLRYTADQKGFLARAFDRAKTTETDLWDALDAQARQEKRQATVEAVLTVKFPEKMAR